MIKTPKEILEETIDEAFKTFDEAFTQAGKIYDEATNEPRWMSEPFHGPEWKAYEKAMNKARKIYFKAFEQARKAFKETEVVE